METTEAIISAANMLIDWGTLLYIILGLGFGVLMGAIPGVSGMIALSIMLIPSFYLSPIEAIVFLTSIYTGSIYGGGITAVLLNIPGAPGAVATGFDGYEMTKAGRHNEALGIGLMASAVGCFAGYFLVLLLFMPIARLVFMFGPSEMLMVVVFALSVIGLIKGELIKTFVAGIFGLLIGTVGASPYGYIRGVFGIKALYEGFPLVPAILGMLAVTELFNMVEKEFIVTDGDIKSKKDIKRVLAGMKSYFIYKLTAIKSIIIGLIIGLLPAAGSTVASMIGYGIAKKSSPRSGSFGKGEPEGIVAAETANNASEGGAIATMMAFGIPGSGVAAVLMAAFMIHGMSPGPYLIRENMDFAYAVVLANLLQGVMLVIVGLIFIYYFSNVVFVPTRFLVPVITIFAVLGALSLRGLVFDAVLLLIFGALGYLFRKFDYPILALILGFVLGRMLESEIIRTHLLFRGKYLSLIHI